MLKNDRLKSDDEIVEVSAKMIEQSEDGGGNGESTMTIEAYVHPESNHDWCLSVCYGKKLAQIRIHGDDAIYHDTFSTELGRLAKALATLSSSASQ